jgi:hypothetical protein
MASNIFKVTSVCQGSVTGITVNNLGSGYTVGSNILFSGSVSSRPPDLIQLSNSSGEPLLSISASGEVIWHEKKPSQAAKQFTTALQGNIDKNAVKRGALERAYLKGLEKCQRMFEQMDPEEAKEKLKKEIDQRREKNCWTTLMDSLETEDDA